MARERILRKLAAAYADGRVSEATLRAFAERCPPAEHRDHDGGLETSIEPPSADALVEMLHKWRDGDLTAYQICDWASWFVDKSLLPEHPPDDPRSIPVEVLLQLSSMHLQPLTTSDVPAIVAFLRAPAHAAVPAWRAWFAYMDGIDWDARKRPRRSSA